MVKVFFANLKDHGIGVEGKDIVIFGAGGAATAIQVQCALDGAKSITIFNQEIHFSREPRRWQRRSKLRYPECQVELYDLDAKDTMREKIDAADILVNGTLLGMKPKEDTTVISDTTMFHEGLVVADVVYNPEETRFLREAKEHGCITVPGKGMLLWQGVASFKLFTGKDMPVDEVKERFFRSIGRYIDHIWKQRSETVISIFLVFFSYRLHILYQSIKEELMDQFNVYKDMKARTNGEIYIGVVGPVRTGKSTFIKRFMNLMVLPNIEDENDRNRANDELPQSSSGKTIMTTEPKFVPNEAVSIKTEEGIELNVRLIDCVGYMVEGATGHMEGEEERLVKTPWFDYEIPFTKAAAIGTKKVITEHSTIGVVVTCDGSFGEIAAKQYEPAEEETIKQLKALKKPFVVLLNTIHPYSESTKQLAAEKEEKYQTKVLPMNLEQMKKEDIYEIIKRVC